MRSPSLRDLAPAALALGLLACTAHSSRTSPSDAGDDATLYPLPPVSDAGLADNAIVRDRATFPCGELTGAASGKLTCDRVYPDFNWDCEPGECFWSIYPKLSADASGNDAAVAAGLMGDVVFELYTGSRMEPLTLTCATLPPVPKGVFTGVKIGLGDWKGVCSSFKLVITAVGTLTSDALGVDPLDATADAFDWDGPHPEVLSDSFHGSLAVTLVDPDGGEPIEAHLAF